MTLTTPQLTTLKANINSLFPGSTNYDAIADHYNTVGAVDVWRTDALVSAIYDAIDWSSYTPVDAAAGTAIYTNRLLLIQIKQTNIQGILIGRETINASKARVRKGLNDSVIAIPSGVSGADVSAGGADGARVLNACVRKANAIEALLASAPAITGTVSAAVMGYEGTVSAQTISDLMTGLLGV
jgi:hypothetical protein